jgi:hypothetical protein
MGALATNRKAAAVAETLIAADLHLALDVLLDFTAKVTLDAKVSFDVCPQLGDVLIAQIANPDALINLTCGEDLLRGRRTDAKQIGERDDNALFAWNVYACNTCHVLALPLLVSRIGADDLDATVPANDPAVVAHFFDAWSYFHVLLRFEIVG